MVLEPVTLGTFAGLAKILDYLRPTRSPYLVAIATTFICFLLLISFSYHIDNEKIHYFLIPAIIFYVAFSIIPVFLYIFARGVSISDDDNVDLLEQFKFSRSIFVSIILISLYMMITSIENINWVFFISYILMISNLVVFSIYLITREIVEDTSLNRNLIQVALINAMIILLVAQYAPQTRIEDGNIWVDCTASTKVNHDQVNDTGEVELDEAGKPLRTQSDVAVAECLPSKVLMQKEFESGRYPNAVVADVSTEQRRFSFRFLVFITSWCLAVFYFVFWLFRIGSVVRLRIIS
ncbi:hypothetical protein SAMN04488498_10844 [Mesorhizobium albiziae]|uniref:Uncharacterized protein n=1 Tax=Neomesorhizobium albiziae TaxID=335020 RepID=A0A1I4AGF7_9HYPH|nr:hypothetical protein [Mesorhizobium albiziae]SFK55250.1 hypothetical protein SAMN04488498_10844 [Mesorhizobium albiziae]